MLIHSCAVPDELVDAAVKAIWRDVREHVSPWHWAVWGQHAFPHLAESRVVSAIVEHLCQSFGLGRPCWAPQIIFSLPNDYGGELTPHVDEPPLGLHYTRILAVALTKWTPLNGSVHLWLWPQVRPDDHAALYMNPGDVLDLPVDALHSPGINRSDMVRIGLYVRWAA